MPARAANQLLITGASGQLAQRVAELLLETVPAERLTLVSRNPGALATFEQRGVTVRRGDFAEPESLADAFAGADRMLLVSATDLERRTQQHGAAIDAAAAAGVRHIVYTSGLAPAAPNPAAVAESHAATEEKLANVGISWTILRNSLYAEFQPVEAERAIESGKLVHNRGNGKVAYVSRDDCAAAAAAVLVSEGHDRAIYDITGPARYGAKDLARLYSEIGGKPVEAVALDDAAFIGLLVGDAAADDHLKYGAELVASFGKSIREGYMASCANAVAELTGRPARPLAEVLRAALVT
ncbi:MAG: NAD(P)H-binding protein [Gammaproteobacteria bacterium]|nr:NAD(P)H-binding protein [Gammaproteobacteria bacterium]